MKTSRFLIVLALGAACLASCQPVTAGVLVGSGVESFQEAQSPASLAEAQHRIPGKYYSYSGDDAYDPAAGGLSIEQLSSTSAKERSLRTSGGYSGDDPYDPAAGGLSFEQETSVGDMEQYFFIQGSYSGDDAYDPAAGLAEATDPGKEVVAIEALTDQSSGRTINLTKVYQRPDSESIVVYMLQATSEVNIIGRSEDGAWYAVTDDNNSQNVGGWISIIDLDVAKVIGQVSSLTKVYQQADSNSPVVRVLTPAQQVEVLGRKAGSNWLVIRSESRYQNAIAYISSSAVRIQREATGTYTPSKAHSRPDQNSYVIDILVPNQKLTVIGRSADGKWFAVENAVTGQFRGWVLVSKVKDADQDLDVPVISLQ